MIAKLISVNLLFVSATMLAQNPPIFGPASGDLGGSYPNPTVTNGSHVTNSSIPNSGLVHPSTTVNGQTCTLGSTCTATAAPSGVAGGALAGTYPNPTAAPTSGFGNFPIQVCHAEYSFATDGGGSPGLITPANNCTVPANSIIYSGLVDWTTPGVGAMNTTSIGITGTGGGAAAILAATAVGSLTGLVPVSAVTFAAPFKIMSSGTVTLTTATTALTAGVCEIYLFYVVSPT